MNVSKKLFSYFLLFMSLQTVIFAEEQESTIEEIQEAIAEPVYRSREYHMLQRLIEHDILHGSHTTTLADHETRITNNETTLADHETRIVDLESMAGGTASASDIHDLAIYNSLLPSNVDRVVVFEGAITVSGGNTLTLSPADRLAAIGATTTITADTVIGIDFGDFTNLQNAAGPLNIDTHVLINNSFTVGESITIDGNLVVNGAVTVGTGHTLTVKGDIILDGQCEFSLVNSGTITADGKIIIKNYKNTGGVAVTNNVGASINSTAASCQGNVTLSNNIGSTVGVLNAGTVTTSDGIVTFLQNNGDTTAVSNTGTVSSTLGDVVFEENGSRSDTGVANSGSVTTTAGDIKFLRNKADDTGVLNTATITATNGDILFDANKGDLVDGVSNSGTITASETITFCKNSGGVYGVENTSTITSTGASLLFCDNEGETIGVYNNSAATITTPYNIMFDGNKGRDQAGVSNSNGSSITATGASSVILFKCNIGRDHGVINNSTSGTSEIRTTNAASPNKTRIIFNGNSGGEQDTINNYSGGGIGANIIAGAAAGVIGTGSVCYDSQRNINIVAGNVSPKAVVCAKDEELVAPIIDTVNVDSSLNKTISFGTDVQLSSAGGGTLTLTLDNELTVLAMTGNEAEIETVVPTPASEINPADYPELIINTVAAGTENRFDADVIIDGNFSVDADLTITGDLRIRGGSLLVDTNSTLTVQGDIVLDGKNLDKNVTVAAGSTLQGRNITIKNYKATSSQAVVIAGTLESMNCGSIILYDNATSADGVEGVLVTGTISADGSLTFKKNANNRTMATDADGVAITSASAISVGGNVNFIGNVGRGTGHGINLSGAIGDITTIKSLSNIMIRGNRSDTTVPGDGAGTGHAFNVGDYVTVSGFNFVIENNASGGTEINISSTESKLHACDSILIDHDLTVSDDVSGILQGRVVINGNLIVDASLTIRGDLVVCGGEVTINNGVTLNVSGDILFDGQSDGSTTDKAVKIEGNINAHDLVIKNYRTSTGTDATVFIQDNGAPVVINATGKIVIENNTSTVEEVVEIRETTDDVSLSACGDILVAGNTVTAASKDAVLLDSGVDITSDGAISFLKNTSINGTPGDGVSTGAAITACYNLSFVKNIGVIGVVDTGTLTSRAGFVIFKDNTGVADSSTSGTLTPSGVVCITTDTVYSSNATINGDLCIQGASVTINDGVVVTVTGDVIFDGQEVADKRVNIIGDLVANTITIKNYTHTTAEAVLFTASSNTITANRDLIIQNNSTTAAGFDAVRIGSSVTVDVAGDLKILQNSGAGAVLVEGTVTAHDALFEDNTGVVGAAGVMGERAVDVTGTITTAGSITFTHNTGGAGGADTTGGAGAVSVFISGVLEAANGIVAVGNTGGAAGASSGGPGATGGAAVYIEDNLTASDIVLKDNVGGAGSDGMGAAGGAGGAGVIILSSSAVTAHGTMVIRDNTGGLGGDSTGATAGSGGDGVTIENTATVTVDAGLTVRGNTGAAGGSDDGSGTNGNGGTGFNVESVVIANGDKVIEGNTGGAAGSGGGAVGAAGVGSNVGATGICKSVTADGTSFYNHDIAASTLGSVTGDVVICGNFTVDASITITGNLFVKGSVTIETGNILTVVGRAFFDGRSVDNKVAIQGTGQLSARDVVIQHYIPTTGVPVNIAGTITVQHGGVQFLHNSATAATNDAINVTGNIVASSDVIFSHNTGITTGDGVQLDSANVTSESGSVRFVNNSSTGDGDGVNMSGATVVIALQDIIAQDNSSGGTGEGFNVDGTSSVTSNGHTHVKDNSTVAVAAGATFDTTNHTLVLDKSSGIVTVSDDFDHSGRVTGHVYVKGSFVVDQDLTIDGDLTVKGSVTVNTMTTLTVTGDILFDGESDGSTTDNGVKIEGNVTARDIVIKNYRRATGSDEAVLIQSNTAAVTVSAKGHIIIENNSSTGTATVGSVNLGKNTGDVEVSAQGDIRFIKNTTDITGVDAVTINIDKPSSLPGLSVGARLACIGNSGVNIAGGIVFAHDMQFYNNSGNNGDTDTAGRNGVTIAGDITAVDTLTLDTNFGGMGGGATAAGQDGGAGILITGAVTTHDWIVNFNVGGAGTAGAAGAAGDNAGGDAGDGVLITGAGAIVTVKGSALLNNNIGGDAGNSTGNATAGRGGDGMSIESTATLITDTGLSVRNNTGGTGGTDDGSGIDGNGGHGFNVASTVIANEGKVVSGNTGGAAGGAGGTAGSSVNVATGIKFVHVDTEGRQFYDHDVTTSTVLGSSVTGDVVVTGDVTIDSDLAITGDLIVRGGAVALGNGVKLTVSGDIIFDGQGSNKNVVIEGDIFGATNQDPGAQNVIIKNYVLTDTNSMSAVTIAATGALVTEHNIEIVNNKGAIGTTGAVGGIGGHGVNIIGLIKAKDSIKLHSNIGGQGGESTGSGNVGTIGGHGVLLSSPLTANSAINIICNIGGVGGLSTDATGGLGAAGVYVDSFLRSNEITCKENIGGAGQAANGTDMDGGAGASGVFFAVASDVLTQATTVIANNTGGAGGAPTGTGNNGDGGNGADLASSASITADSVISIRNNSGGATDTGGTSGSGFVLNSSATLRALGNKAIFDNTSGVANGGSSGSSILLNGTCVTINSSTGKTIYDGDTTTSTIGSVTADICVNGTLTVDSSEIINGNLEVNGSVITTSASHVLSVSGDVIFDGKNANTVTIAGSDIIQACSITIQNYRSTTDHAVSISGTLLVDSDAVIKNNSVDTFAGNAVNISGSTIIAKCGTMLFTKNSSSTDHGVEVSGSASLEAMNIIFGINSSSEAVSHGVYIDGASVIAHNDLRFTNNFGGVTTGNGVLIGDMTATTIMAASLFVIVTCTSQCQHFVIDSNTTKTDFYGATLLEHVSNTGTACIVDLTA